MAKTIGKPKTASGLTFNAKLPRAERAAQANAARLVTNVSQETIVAIRSIIVRSIAEGIPPREAARIIRELVGMNTPQAIAAMTHRQQLIEAGLSLDRVDVLMERYTKKKIRERAMMIARTETIDALTAGQEESWKQARAEGLLDDTAQKEWITTPDDRTCPICAPLDGETVGLDEEFSGGFARPPAHPRCRCAVVAVP